MRRTGIARDSGVSMVELIIAAALTAFVLGVGVIAVITGKDASTITISLVDADEKLRDVLQTISNELRWSSRLAEDTNANTLFDAGEDTNSNLRFENDWNLTKNSVTFNVRRGSGGYSLPITYSLVAGELRKTVIMDVSGRTAVTVLVRNVAEFSVTDSNPGVIVSLGITVLSEEGETLTRSQAMTVMPRN